MKSKLYYSVDGDIMCIVYTDGTIEKFLGDNADEAAKACVGIVNNWYEARFHPEHSSNFELIGEIW